MTCLVHGVVGSGAVGATTEPMHGAVPGLVTTCLAGGRSVALSAESAGPPESFSRPGVASVVADIRIDDRAALAGGVGPMGAQSDGELLLDGYRRFGLGVAGRVVGDGVFILWDEVSRQLVAWRDVAGTRPLYYRRNGDGSTIVSSDLRSLAAHPGVPVELDLAYVAGQLRGGPHFHSTDRTFLAGVRKVPAAHLLVVGPDGVRLVRYWSPDDVEPRRHRSDGDYVEELRGLLRSAVGCRLGDSERVGAHLSGGLDSSSIAVVGHRLARERDRALVGTSWAPPYEVLETIPDDERPLVGAVAEQDSIDVRFSRPLPAEFLELETRDLALRPMTTLQLELGASRAVAAQGVTTILSGWGGDELVVNNGKGYFSDLARRGRWVRLHRELRRRGAVHGSSYLSQVRGRVVLPQLPDAAAVRLGLLERADDLELPTCLRPEFRRLLTEVDHLPVGTLRERPGVRRYQVEKLEYGHLQYRMESWAAHGADVGIRYEYPLLDRSLIEFALAIPDHLYFRDGWKRWLYRTAMEGVLPDSVRWHPDKIDTAMMQHANAVRASMREQYFDRLLEERGNPYIDVERYVTMIRNGRPVTATGSAPNAHALWLPFTSAGVR